MRVRDRAQLTATGEVLASVLCINDPNPDASPSLNPGRRTVCTATHRSMLASPLSGSKPIVSSP